LPVTARRDAGSGGIPRAGDGRTTARYDAGGPAGGDNRGMDSTERPRAQLALGALLGLLAVAELLARLTAGPAVRAGMAAVPAAHHGVTVPTALLMCAFCLLAPAVTRRLISEFARLRPARDARAPAALSTLTPRETEVLRLVAEGLSNPEIARRLVVTEETVKTHVSRILAKLGLRDRTQAVVAAYESGLVVPGRDGD